MTGNFKDVETSELSSLSPSLPIICAAKKLLLYTEGKNNAETVSSLFKGSWKRETVRVGKESNVR